MASVEIPPWLADEEAIAEGTTLGSVWSYFRSAFSLRHVGNAAFAAGHFDEAKRAYIDAESSIARAECLAHVDGLEAQDSLVCERFLVASSALRGALHSNLSLVSLRLSDAHGAHWHASRSLDIQPSSIKAMYRRALASLELGEPAEAETDLRAALKIEPSNVDVRAVFRQCQLARRCKKTSSQPSSSLHIAPADNCVCPAPLSGSSLAETCSEVSCGSDLSAQVCEVLCDQSVFDLKQFSRNELSIQLCKRDEQGRTPLHGAAWGGIPGNVEALLDVGAQVDLVDKEERTPLHLAALQGHAAAVALLLEAGSAVDIRDEHDRTPLYYAGVRDHREAVALLVGHGADQSVLFRALKEKFGTHNFALQEWPEYNGRWMTSKEGRVPDAPLRRLEVLPQNPDEVQAQSASS